MHTYCNVCMHIHIYIYILYVYTNKQIHIHISKWIQSPLQIKLPAGYKEQIQQKNGLRFPRNAARSWCLVIHLISSRS